MRYSAERIYVTVWWRRNRACERAGERKRWQWHNECVLKWDRNGVNPKFHINTHITRQQKPYASKCTHSHSNDVKQKNIYPFSIFVSFLLKHNMNISYKHATYIHINLCYIYCTHEKIVKFLSNINIVWLMTFRWRHSIATLRLN